MSERYSFFRSGVVLALILAFVSGVIAPPALSQEPSRSELEEFDFANGLFSRGMYDVAIDVYKAFLKKYPESSYAELAEYRIGEAYFVSERYEEALNRLTSFTDKYSSGELYLKAELRRGQCYYFLGDDRAAEKILKGLVDRKDAGDVPEGAGYYLASLHMKKGDYSTSKNMLEGLLGEGGDGEYAFFSYITLGDVYKHLDEADKAVASYVKAGEHAPSGTLKDEAMLREANIYFREGKYDKAAGAYENVVGSSSSEGTYLSAVEGLFSALYRMGDNDRIIELSSKYIAEAKTADIRSRLLFITGNAYLQIEDPEKALEMFNEVSSKYPDSEYAGESLLSVSWILFKEGDNAGCIKKIDEYLEYPDADREESEFLRGKTLYAMGKKQESSEMLTELAANASNPVIKKEALYQLASVYDSMGESNRAAEEQLRFAETYKDDERSPAMLLKTAQFDMRSGRYDKAMGIYEDFQGRYPSSDLTENVVFQYARAYQEAGRNNEAVEKFQEFLERFPDSQAKPKALYWLARAYQSGSNWDDSISILSELVSTHKGAVYAPALEALAYSYYEKGENEKAAETYYDLISEKPETILSVSVYMWVAEYQLAEEKVAAAREVLDRLSVNVPEAVSDPAFMLLYGRVSKISGDNEKASEYFKGIIDAKAKAPYLENAYIELGNMAYGLNDLEEALELYKKALEVHQDNASGAMARMGIADVYYKMMNFDEAAKQYMMVAILYEDKEITPRALYMAAASFLKVNKMNESDEAVKELISRYPKSEFSEKAKQELEGVDSEAE